MAASYFENGMNGPATFDLSIRELPEQRNFLVVCGLEQALGYLEDLRFEDDSLSYLRSLGLFTDEFLSFLGGLSFTGKIWAVPEGETVFASEPLIRVTAPIIEAQIVESFLMNCITFQTMVASKAARVAVACGDRQFVDYSLRRDHGADAGLKAARASFIAGASATSNVLAGKLYGIPVSGTMAHSYVMAFESEISAFRAYARVRRPNHPSHRYVRRGGRGAQRRDCGEGDRSSGHEDQRSAHRFRRSRKPHAVGAKDPRRSRPRLHADRALG